MKLKAYFVLVFAPLMAFAWGQKGHDVVVNLATNHLTPKAAAAVDSIFEGKSPVYWANWLDNASHTTEYDYSRTWHYINIDANETFDNAQKQPKGDIVKALNEQITLLMGPNTSPADSKLALKMVVHLMGDLHQPMHVGLRSDLGGNKHKVKFFDNETNLHSVWDSRVLETGHKWSYTEWTDQIDRASKELQNELLKGSISDWTRESHEIAKEIYQTTPMETVVGYDYIARWTPTIEQQLLKGGLRLAHVLNYIFDENYRQSNSSPLDKK